LGINVERAGPAGIRIGVGCSEHVQRQWQDTVQADV
jgi:hypothetical protein